MTAVNDIRLLVQRDPAVRREAEQQAYVANIRPELVIAVYAAVEQWCFEGGAPVGTYDEKLARLIAGMPYPGRARQMREELPRLRPDIPADRVEPLVDWVTEYVDGAARGDRAYLFGFGSSR